MALISRSINQQQGRADNLKKEPKRINGSSVTCRIIQIWKFNSMTLNPSKVADFIIDKDGKKCQTSCRKCRNKQQTFLFCI